MHLDYGMSWLPRQRCWRAESPSEPRLRGSLCREIRLVRFFPLSSPKRLSRIGRPQKPAIPAVSPGISRACWSTEFTWPLPSLKPVSCPPRTTRSQLEPLWMLLRRFSELYNQGYPIAKSTSTTQIRDSTSLGRCACLGAVFPLTHG